MREKSLKQSEKKFTKWSEKTPEKGKTKFQKVEGKRSLKREEREREGKVY